MGYQHYPCRSDAELPLNLAKVLDNKTEFFRRFATEDSIMAGKEKRKGGGRLQRSETVTVRLDPKLRYLAELGARKQRRTLSSFIEWAIEHSLQDVVVEEGWDQHTKKPYQLSLAHIASDLWDVGEEERFARLAIRYPDLLTHEEQVLWKLIRENGSLWRGDYDLQGYWMWKVTLDDLIMSRLREHWETFRQVASGDADASMLPTWQSYNPDEDMTRREDDDIGA
jgi:hypothetical protein